MNIAHSILGEGQPLVLSPWPRWGQTQREWLARQIKDWYGRLAETHIVLRFDLRSPGLSGDRARPEVVTNAGGVAGERHAQRGMLPKVEACLTAARQGTQARIVDGREPGAVVAALAGTLGTRVG